MILDFILKKEQESIFDILKDGVKTLKKLLVKHNERNNMTRYDIIELLSPWAMIVTGGVAYTKNLYTNEIIITFLVLAVLGFVHNLWSFKSKHKGV